MMKSSPSYDLFTEVKPKSIRTLYYLFSASFVIIYVKTIRIHNQVVSFYLFEDHSKKIATHVLILFVNLIHKLGFKTV